MAFRLSGHKHDQRCFWLLSPDNGSSTELAALLKQLEPQAEFRHFSDPKALLAATNAADGPLPEACFLDICAFPSDGFTLLAHLTSPARPIATITWLTRQDHSLALQCLRQGAAACLVSPLDVDQLKPVLARLGFSSSTAENTGSGNLICVLPAQGSCGATLLAVNLAHQALRSGLRRLLLVDFDTLAGTIGFVLKLKPHYSIAEALAHAAKLDADLWKGLVVNHRGVDVLLAPENPLENEIEATQALALVAFIRRNYEMCVLDTGGVFVLPAAELARLADSVLLLLAPEIGSLYNARKTLAYLSGLGVPATRVQLIISQTRRQAAFKPEEIEKALGLGVFHILPHAPQAIEDALLEGRPVAASSTLGQSYRELADKLLNQSSRLAKASAIFCTLRSLFNRSF